MWSLKKNLTVLAVLVGTAISAWGADVWPLYFDGIGTRGSDGSYSHEDSLLQQSYWEYLTKFKLWGTNGISSGHDLQIGDAVGWSGTASGNITMGERFLLNGPIIVGGTITAYRGGSFSGPVRASALNLNEGNDLYGQYCLVSSPNAGVVRDINKSGGSYLYGDDFYSEQCDSSSVPGVKSDLKVPLVGGTHTYISNGCNDGKGNSSNCSISQWGKKYIDVPPGEGMYDLYIDNISFNASGPDTLFVRMPEGGRLTRIFTQNGISLGHAASILVQYVDEGASYDYTKKAYANGVNGRIIDNADYAGNLMFYSPKDVTFQNGNGIAKVQGTFICKGTLTIGHDMKIAGQFIAENIKAQERMQAEDFHFVPFDPPLISLNMAVDQQLTEREYPAGSKGDTLAIKLTKAPTTDVTFKYCFVLDGTQSAGSAKAMAADFDMTKVPMKLCTSDTSYYDKALIKEGELSPQNPILVWINNDGILENTESFKLKVWDLEGGTFSDNSREWDVRFYINDLTESDPVVPVCPTGLVFTGDEDELWSIGDFEVPLQRNSADAGTTDLFDITITSVPKGSFNYSVGSMVSSTTIFNGDLKYQGKTDEFGVPGSDYEYTTVKFTVTAVGSTTSECSMKIKLKPVNDAPTVTGLDVSIRENAPKDSLIGQVIGKDKESAPLYYAFTYGNVGNAFRIDNAGKIYVNSVIDYDAFAAGQARYPLVVSVCEKAFSTDASGNPVCKDALSGFNYVNITILNENEAPVLVANNGTVYENAAKGTTVGSEGGKAHVEASDPEEDYTKLKYEIIDGNVNNVFTIDNEGYLIVNGTIDYETKKQYTLKVRVTDNGDEQGKNVKSAETTVIVDVLNENEPPVVPDTTFSVDENSKVGTIVGVLKVTDVDTEIKNLVFSIKSGNTDNAFEFVGDTLKVRTAVLDFENLPTYTLKVSVSDGANTVEAKVVVNVIDVNEKPTINDITGKVPENAAAGKLASQIFATDPENTELEMSYTILGDTAAVKYFKVQKDSVVTLRTLTAIDYETHKSFEFKIVVTDKGGKKDTADVKVTIEPQNEAPTAKGFTATLRENEVPKDALGTVAVKDPDEGDSHTFTIAAGNEEGFFKLDASGNLFAVKAVNYEYATSYTLYIVVKDKGGEEARTEATVTIVDVNEAPSTADKNFTVKENQDAGIVVGVVPVSDPDEKADFKQNKFELVEGDVEDFKIDSKTGKITTAKSFDYEEKSSYNFKVRVYDQDGNEAFSNVTVTIQDVKEYSKLVITRAETESGEKGWDNPTDAISVNETAVILQWTADGIRQPDTLVENLHEGYNTITLSYKDPKKNEGASVQQVVFVSTKTPVVTVGTKEEKVDEGDIFTIVEDKVPGDTSVYASSKNNDIVITVKEPVLDETYTETSCNWNTKSVTIETKLEPVKVPSTAVSALNSVVEAGVYLNEHPSTPVTHAPYNGNQVKVSYTDKVGNTEVKVSYVTDEKGNPVKETVVDMNGNIQTIEVITVSTEVMVGDQKVTISYMADAATGQLVITPAAAGIRGDISNYTNQGTGSSVDPSSSTSGSGSGTGTKPGSSGSIAGSSDSGSGSGTGTGSGTGAKPGSSNSIAGSSDSGSGSGTGSGNGSSNSGSGNGNSGNGGSMTLPPISLEGIFTVTYDYTTKVKGVETTLQVSYAADEKGNVVKDADGNVGYTVSYTYENELGNSSSESVFIVVDIIPPKVEILYPAPDTVLYSNSVDVKWTVDYGDGRGPIVQDTLVTQGLEKGVNAIVRFYVDKAGNMASDTVFVVMKNAKDVDIQIESPVTTITTKDVEERYATKVPEKGQTFAVSVYSPKLGKEVETQVGGDFKTKQGSGDEPYPGAEKHLGPTLSIETKMPVISNITGLATMDDLIGKDGQINLDGVDAASSRKISVDDYVLGFKNDKGEQVDYCTEEFREDYRAAKGDLSRLNMYTTTMSMKLWVYTSLGQFVDYFEFTQEVDDPDLVSDAGMLKLFFEQKPDKNGDLRTKDGRIYATGAYIYKTDVSLKTTLRCSLPPVSEDMNPANKKNAKRKVTENMLKTFGYKRPSEDK